MSCAPKCRTCGPASRTCAASWTRSTPRWPTGTPTSSSLTTWTASWPSYAVKLPPPAQMNAAASSSCSSRTSSSARRRSPSATASLLALAPAASPSATPSPTRRVTIAQVAKCVGGVTSPLLSNVALSVLDEYVAQAPGGPGASRNDRLRRRRHGLPNYRLSRYADDWCLVVSGTKADAEALRGKIAGVLSTMGLRLSSDKTLITHIDGGLDFLGWHIQRRRKRGTNRRYVYTYPSRKALKAVTVKVKMKCRQNINLPLSVL